MESLLPFLQGTCTPYNMPVYPGAQCQIADALTEKQGFTWPNSRVVVHMASEMRHGADVKCAGTTEVSCQLCHT